jgi:DNA ligase-1
MEYSVLSDAYRNLEKTSARLKKVDIIAGLLRKTESELLPKVTLLLQGRVFPAYSEKEIGIAERTIIRIISSSTGYSESGVFSVYKETGDLGLTTERIMSKKSQSTLFRRKVDVDRIFSSLQELADIEGKGSQERKMRIVGELIMHSSPEEAKYIVRTLLGQLRIGVAEGVIRDAIARAFFPEKEKKDAREVINAIEWAWFLRSDYGEVAVIAKEKGLKGLNRVRLAVGKPYFVSLAERAVSLEAALDSFESPALEYKYDGARLMIHKRGQDVWLYTRRLENVTKQFPEVVEQSGKRIRAHECIIEGEMVGFDSRTGKPLAFQKLSQRIKRKYDIQDMAIKIPIQVNLFDITYLEGEELFKVPFRERRKKLESIVEPLKGRFQLAKQLVTKDRKRAESFYQESLDAGQEGLIVKNMDAPYQPGRRVGFWLKVKPTMENLDLAIIGAAWGTGKRAGWLGSLVLGARDPESGDFRECGMIGTGIKEKEGQEGITFSKLTKLLKPNIQEEKGNKAIIKPNVVVEVAYEEIQKSPNYSSGYALRFPRVVRIRTDKGPGDTDTVERLGKLFHLQRGRQ